MKILEKSSSIVTVYAHPYVRYCGAREPNFIHMNYHTLFLKMCQNINSMNMKITVAKNKKLRTLFIMGRYNHDWYIFNKKAISFQFFPVVSGKL